MGSGSLSTVLTCTDTHTSEGVCICVKQMWTACMHTCMHSSLHQQQRCICYIGRHECHESSHMHAMVQAEATLWQVGSQ